MIKISLFSCLLFALSIVQVKPLSIHGRVRGSVTLKCSGWDVLTDVRKNVKYLCESPCTVDKHIIIKTAFRKTNHKDQIKLTNNETGLFVTFTNLQKSDSKKYYCGVERAFWRDPLIEVNLKVTDAGSLSPKTTPKSVVIGSTVSMVLSNSTIMASNGSETITNIPSVTQGAGNVPYLVIGAIVIITILMVLLMLMRKTMKKQMKVVTSVDTAQEETREDPEYDEIRPEDQQTVSQAGVSTLYLYADPDSLFANYSYQQGAEFEGSGNKGSKGVVSLNSASNSVTNASVVYSVVQLPKERIELATHSEPNQSESSKDDSFYSLAQIPQAP